MNLREVGGVRRSSGGESPTPLVSVIIPAKDRCGLLLEALASIQHQTYPHWEAVVVDDGSSDGTWRALGEVAACDARIRPLRRTGPVAGAPVARNQGAAASRGHFLLFLDSDDLLTPDALERRVRMAAAHPECDAVVFQAEHFTGAPGGRQAETAYRMHLLQGVDPLDGFLAYHVPWYISGPLWPRAVVERLGPWDVRWPFGQDLEYHVRALAAGVRFACFPQVDQYCRGHQGPSISRLNNRTNQASRLALLDHVLGLLQARGLLTARRRRMAAWSAFWGTLGYTHETPPDGLPDALALWRAVRQRRLVSACGYLVGRAIASGQRLPGVSPLLAELARLSFHNDLKARPLWHPAVWRSLVYQLRWALRRWRAGGDLQNEQRAWRDFSWGESNVHKTPVC